MKCVGLFQAGILLDFSEGDSPGGWSLMGGNFPGGSFPGKNFHRTMKYHEICKKGVNTFVFVSRAVAL